MESFACRVETATRRKYTPEEKIRSVLEGSRREVTVSSLRRREGIRPHTYYLRAKEFMDVRKGRLTCDSGRDGTRQEIQRLKREVDQLPCGVS